MGTPSPCTSAAVSDASQPHARTARCDDPQNWTSHSALAGLDLRTAPLHPFCPVRRPPMIRTALLALLVAGTAFTAHAQDLLIRGGPIYTGVDGAPVAEA